MVTSPPYDNLRIYNGNIQQWNFDKFKSIANELYRVIKTGGVVVWIVGDSTIKGSETGTSFRQALYFKEVGFCLHDTMIWQKPSCFTHKNRYIADFEYMFVFSKGKPKTANLIRDRKNKYAGTKIHGTVQAKNDGNWVEANGQKKGRIVQPYGCRYNVWAISGDTQNRTGHPAVFPEQLAHDHIITWSNEGDTVLDPFMGSGTTGIACLKTNRIFIGVEIDDEYFKIAKSRIENVKEEND